MSALRIFLIIIGSQILFSGCYTQLALMRQTDSYTYEIYESDDNVQAIETDTMYVDGADEFYITQYETPEPEVNYYYYSSYYDPFWNGWPYYANPWWPGYYSPCCYPPVYIGYCPPYPYYDHYWYGGGYYDWGWGGGSYMKPVKPRSFVKGGYITRNGGSKRAGIGAIARGKRNIGSKDKIYSNYAVRKKSGRSISIGSDTNTKIVRAGSAVTGGTGRVIKSAGKKETKRKYYRIKKASSGKTKSGSNRSNSRSSVNKSNSRSNNSSSSGKTYSTPSRGSSSYSGTRSSRSGASRSFSSGSGSRSGSSRSGGSGSKRSSSRRR